MTNRRIAKVIPMGDLTDVPDYDKEKAMENVDPRHQMRIEHTEDESQKLELIREAPYPLYVKRILRCNHVSDMCGWKRSGGCGYEIKRFGGLLKDVFQEIIIRLELWRNSVKVIEGTFGSGVAAYFVFLKWLFILNVWIFLLTFVFIVIPQITFTESNNYDWWVSGNISSTRLTLTSVCTSLYDVKTSFDDIFQVCIDFLQGTGWMEPTALFYGYYSDRRLTIGTFDGVEYSYNMPLAYLLVTVAYIIISLVMMLRHSATGLKASIVETEENKNKYTSIIFAGWDHNLNEPKSIKLRQKSLCNEFLADLEEEREEKRRLARSGCARFFLFIRRFIINVFVIGVLGGAGYLIYFATEQSPLLTQRSDYEDMHKLIKLLIEYIPSVTITFLNFVIPFVFVIVVKGEDYKIDTAVKVTLGRTVFLRLASLAMLVATVYLQVTCGIKDDCDVGIQPDCPSIRCWESYVGQQLYKLVIMDFISVTGVVFVVNFPRTLVVKKCSCKLAQKVGMPEFDIPKNVLDLVYSQTLCWLGAYFSPLTPAICVLTSFIVFYLKKLTCMYNHVPAAKPYRASRLHSFFMIVLLSAFLLTCVPIGYIIWKLAPSKGCGPFRIYNFSYEIMDITVNTLPLIIQTIVSFLISPGFIMVLVAILCTVAYYYAVLASANKDKANLLKKQFCQERLYKMYLRHRLRSSQARTNGDNTRRKPLPASQPPSYNTSPEREQSPTAAGVGNSGMIEPPTAAGVGNSGMIQPPTAAGVGNSGMRQPDIQQQPPYYNASDREIMASISATLDEVNSDNRKHAAQPHSYNLPDREPSNISSIAGLDNVYKRKTRRGHQQPTSDDVPGPSMNNDSSVVLDVEPLIPPPEASGGVGW